jgi:hypothetical protein
MLPLTCNDDVSFLGSLSQVDQCRSAIPSRQRYMHSVLVVDTWRASRATPPRSRHLNRLQILELPAKFHAEVYAERRDRARRLQDFS